MKYLLPLFIFAFLISCKGDETTNDDPEDEPRLFMFETHMQKLSYCIGLDHGRGCYNAYSSKEVGEAFNVREIHAGMVDYLSGNDLRIDFFSKDSILDLYLLEDGQVDASVVTKNDASYCVGMDEAFNLINSLVVREIDQEIDVEMLIVGVDEAMQNVADPIIKYYDAQKEVDEYFSELNLEKGLEFMNEMESVEGATKTESGLIYEIISEGSGSSPNLTDSVVIHYTGRYIDGRVFESTIPSGIPYNGSMMNVIKGWQEGVMLMKEGGQRRLYVPPFLAYGKEGKGVIESNQTLVFDIELIEVKRFTGQ